MTARTPGFDDPADAPFLDEAEHAESSWLLARETDPTARAPSSKIASDYAELEDLLGNLPQTPADDSWYDVAPVPAPRPWLRRATAVWATSGALVTGAVVAVWLLLPRVPAELEVAVRHGEKRRGGELAAPGDRLVVTARPSEPADLRVYRSDGPLVAACPGVPGCSTATPQEYTLEITLAPGRYHVILVVGQVDVPPAGTMDTYLYAARTANARIVTYQPIDVH